MKHYDHIFIVTNDLTNERRVKRIINVITDHHRSVFLIGRELNGSVPLGDSVFDQHRVQCWFNGGPLFYFEFYLRATWLIIRNFNADHITCNDLDTILIGRTLKRFLDFKLYLDCHEWFEEVPELNGKALKRGIWKWVAKRCIPVTDARYTVNALIGQQMGTVYNCDFEVVHNVNPTLQNIDWGLKKSQDPIRVIYLGVLNEGRGLKPLIESMEQLDKVELDIIGDGDIADRVNRLVDESPVRDRIALHGSLSPEQFTPLLERAHIGVNLLEARSKSYYYSSANKVHDYINHGLVVLTMDYPYYNELSQSYDSMVLIDKLDSGLIAQSIKEMISTYELEAIQADRETYLASYNWEKEEDQIRDIYRL